MKSGIRGQRKYYAENDSKEVDISSIFVEKLVEEIKGPRPIGFCVYIELRSLFLDINSSKKS